MTISVFDLLKIGIGPSSSHTVGPMHAAGIFARELQVADAFKSVTRVKAEMYGSLGATGLGHGTPRAVILGLEGETPEQIDVSCMAQRVNAVREHKRLMLAGLKSISFDENTDLVLDSRNALPLHPNGMLFTAFNGEGSVLLCKTFYSVGGGFVVEEPVSESDPVIDNVRPCKYPFTTGTELLALCESTGFSISELMLKNELSWREEDEIRTDLLALWEVMQACVQRGCEVEGILPGGLKVKRRAAELYKKLLQKPQSDLADPLTVLDWVTLYALAVNEENASGGRVVTAPTNGAAGIIPAVMHYYVHFVPGAEDSGVIRFLLTAAAIGILYKENASISGAEVGCQGEVGSACSMAAGALAEVLGGSPQQVENAAEIAMEHNLGLTCDPIGGLVQVPCIERNAMGAIKAISAARMALRGDGSHFVSLDKVIKTMRDTGRDMQDKYKETARGGLAINVVEVPVNIIEC